MWRLKGCPRCRGDLVLCYGCWCCLSCGFEHPEYMRGSWCPYREGLCCQEGYCSDCGIFTGMSEDVRNTCRDI